MCAVGHPQIGLDLHKPDVCERVVPSMAVLPEFVLQPGGQACFRAWSMSCSNCGSEQRVAKTRCDMSYDHEKTPEKPGYFNGATGNRTMLN